MKKHVYIIAEAGVNHNGSIELAKKLVDVAVQAGVDAVKFQTFKADAIAVKDAPKADYQKNTTEVSETQFEMLKKLELSYESHKELKEYCLQKKIDFLSTPFDLKSVDMLNSLGIKVFKVGSGDITNAPLLLNIARTGKPIILSTGMSTLGEVEQALAVIAFGYLFGEEAPSMEKFLQAYSDKEGQVLLQKNVSLLHCTTEYPAPLNEVNLNVMKTLKKSFGLSIGYSDHTKGYDVVLAAVALGASIVEKHFTLDRNMKGPDHKASLEPQELADMVRSIRSVEVALGSYNKIPTKSELKNRSIARKSIVADVNIGKEEIFSYDNITYKRPGDGISPMRFTELVGKKAGKEYLADEKI